MRQLINFHGTVKNVNSNIYSYLSRRLSSRCCSMLKPAIFWFPFTFLFLLFVVRTLSWPHYVRIVQEDSIIEYSTAFIYTITAVVAIYIGVALIRKKNVYLGVCCFFGATAFLFVSIEEISWGQRILNIESPEYFLDNNLQEEITLHNLEPFQKPLHYAYMAVCLWCLIGRMLIPKLNGKTFSQFARLAAPAHVTLGYFIPALIFYGYWEFARLPIVETFDVKMFHWRDQEPTEFLMSCGFFIHLLINQHYLKQKDP